MQSFGLQAFEHAVGLLERRFGSHAGNDRLAYHNEWHTDGVVGRARRIANALGLSERDVELVLIAASFHDSVQKWKRVGRADGAIVRQRMVRLNEMESAQEAVAWMLYSSGEHFTPAELDLVADAILVTIPSWDATNGTVVQHRLQPHSHGVIRAVALADIGSPGMDTVGFLRDTQTLFIEENLDVAGYVYDHRSGSPGGALQPMFLERYSAWLQSQAGFARGRQALFENELGIVDDAAKVRVHALFRQFDSSIESAQRVHAESLGISYVQMIERLRHSL